MKQSIQQNGLALAGFAATCALVVVLVNHLTKDTIIEQQRLVLLQTLNNVLPSDKYDNNLINDCILVTDRKNLGSDNPQHIYRAYKNGQRVAAIIETTAPDGYTGSISLMTAYYLDGTVSGVRVLNHRETPGLGDKIDERKSDWISKFAGQQVKGEKDNRWAVKKDQGIFDQFTGATITPRAVVKAIKNTALYFANHQDDIFNTSANCNPAEENTHE